MDNLLDKEFLSSRVKGSKIGRQDKECLRLFQREALCFLQYREMAVKD